MVPSPLLLPPWVVFWISFPHFFFQRVPPSRTCPPSDFFDGLSHCIGFFTTSPSHDSPHTFCKFAYRKGKPVCIHISLAILHVLVWKSTHVSCLLTTEQAYHCLGFPTFDLFHRLDGPRPFFTLKGKDCTDVVHQSLTLCLPRNIFAFANQNVLPDGFVCKLHPFFFGIVLCPLTIHRTAQYLECIVRGILQDPVQVLKIMSIFSSDS